MLVFGKRKIYLRKSAIFQGSSKQSSDVRGGDGGGELREGKGQLIGGKTKSGESQDRSSPRGPNGCLEEGERRQNGKTGRGEEDKKREREKRKKDAPEWGEEKGGKGGGEPRLKERGSALRRI